MTDKYISMAGLEPTIKGVNDEEVPPYVLSVYMPILPADETVCVLFLSGSSSVSAYCGANKVFTDLDSRNGICWSVGAGIATSWSASRAGTDAQKPLYCQPVARSR